MAFSLNRVQIIGNLTRDPEVRQTPGGQTVASFGVATNFSWTDRNGVRQEKAEFHNIVAWAKLAEICGQYLKRGKKIYAEGRLQTREWEGPDGVKRYRTEIVLENMIMLDNARGMAGTSPRQQASMAASPVQESSPESPVMDAELPVETSLPDAVASKPRKDDEVSIDDLPF